MINDSKSVWIPSHCVTWLGFSVDLGRANWLSCVTACYPSADLEAAGAWSQLSNLKDPELQQLAKEVPDTLLSGKADSTTDVGTAKGAERASDGRNVKSHGGCRRTCAIIVGGQIACRVLTGICWVLEV